MQPYFLPYIGYFQLINSVDVFVIYDSVNFIKKGWIVEKVKNNNYADDVYVIKIITKIVVEIVN